MRTRVRVLQKARRTRVGRHAREDVPVLAVAQTWRSTGMVCRIEIVSDHMHKVVASWGGGRVEAAAPRRGRRARRGLAASTFAMNEGCRGRGWPCLERAQQWVPPFS
eukprot:4587400-Pleurochrysis_carterae.AAC.2